MRVNGVTNKIKILIIEWKYLREPTHFGPCNETLSILQSKGPRWFPALALISFTIFTNFIFIFWRNANYGTSDKPFSDKKKITAETLQQEKLYFVRRLRNRTIEMQSCLTAPAKRKFRKKSLQPNNNR